VRAEFAGGLREIVPLESQLIDPDWVTLHVPASETAGGTSCAGLGAVVLEGCCTDVPVMSNGPPSPLVESNDLTPESAEAWEVAAKIRASESMK
jgi:hypothetical protein